MLMQKERRPIKKPRTVLPGEEGAAPAAPKEKGDDSGDECVHRLTVISLEILRLLGDRAGTLRSLSWSEQKRMMISLIGRTTTRIW
jgi:hypothetical protein